MMLAISMVFVVGGIFVLATTRDPEKLWQMGASTAESSDFNRDLDPIVFVE